MKEIWTEPTQPCPHARICALQRFTLGYRTFLLGDSVNSSVGSGRGLAESRVIGKRDLSTDNSAPPIINYARNIATKPCCGDRGVHAASLSKPSAAPKKCLPFQPYNICCYAIYRLGRDVLVLATHVDC